jgi:hypothetical protein
MLDFAIPDLYPKLEMGARKLEGDEAEKVLNAQNLKGLPPIFYDTDDGLNLVSRQGNKYQPNVDAPTAVEILNFIKSQHSYGSKVTGDSLEGHFQGFEYGWERDLLRLVLAILFRAGAIEIRHQGERYTSYSSPEARIPLTSNRAFKSATFAPRETINLKTLADAAKHYEDITGKEINTEEEPIAEAFKALAQEDKEILLPLQYQASNLSLPVSEMLQEFMQTVDSVINSQSDESVQLLAGEGMSYKSSREKIRALAETLTEEHTDIIRKAQNVISSTMPILQKLRADSEIAEKAEELKSQLESQDFYEKLESIRQNARAIFSVYKNIYTEKHNKRKAEIDRGIEAVKGHANFALLDQENQDAVLASLMTRSCNKALLKDSNTCENCGATIEQLESDILAVQGLKENAFKRIEELTGSEEEKIEFIHVSDVVTGYLEKEEDVDTALQKLKEKIMKMLAEGYKISIQ